MKNILSLLAIFISTYSFAQNTEPAPAPPPVENKVFEKDEDIFQRVEVEAEFEGGSKAWREFLMKNLNINVASDKKAKAGNYTVIVRFIVSRNGTLSNFVIESNPGYGTGEEVLRVMKKSPKWKPGYQNGTAVNSIKRQPITFVVSEE